MLAIKDGLGLDLPQATDANPLTEWQALLDQVVDRARRSTDRKQDRSKRTEQQILNAALRVFARDGISRSRIADIAAEAGISTSTLYEYYKSKEDLAYEVPSYHLASFFEGYRAAAADKTGVFERIQLYLTMSADFARVVLFLVREGMDSGDLSPDMDPYQTAAMLFGPVNQMVITWLLYRRPRNLTRASNELAERVLSLLAHERKLDRGD